MLQLSWRRMLLPHGKQMLKSFRKLIQLIRWVQAQAAKLPCPARPLTLPPLNSNYATSLAPSPLRPYAPTTPSNPLHINTRTTTDPQFHSAAAAQASQTSRIFADCPSLARVIILQQQHLPQALPQQREQQREQPPPPVTKPQPQQRPPSAPQRRRASVLLKPQYACFLQHDADALQQSQPKQPKQLKLQPARKAASFSQQQQQSKYRKPIPATTTTTTITAKSTTPATTTVERRRASLPLPIAHHRLLLSSSSSFPSSSSSSSLTLPNASTALLQTRIPGNTLYYV